MKGLLKYRQMICNAMMQNKQKGITSSSTLQLTFKQLQLGFNTVPKTFHKTWKHYGGSLSICYVRLDLFRVLPELSKFICPDMLDSKHLQLCRPSPQLLDPATMLQWPPQANSKNMRLALQPNSVLLMTIKTESHWISMCNTISLFFWFSNDEHWRLGHGSLYSPC